MPPAADQVQVESLLMGPGTGIHIESARGLESITPKAAPIELLGDGVDFGSDDFRDVLQVVFTLNLEADDQDGLDTLLESVRDAWTPGGDKTLQWHRRGRLRSVDGRTGRLVVDEANSHSLSIDIVAEFVANPEVTGS